MNICDRTWKRDGVAVAATVTLALEGPEVDEIYHLCPSEAEAVRAFLNNPAKPSKEGRPRKVLRLSDKA